MRAAVAADPDYPALLFIHQGTPTDSEAFFSDFWPEARAVADSPPLPLYRGFGLEQASATQIMNMGVMTCSIRAIAKGNIPGKTIGDSRQMPGLFLVQGDEIQWQHDYAHIGDSPDWSALPSLLPTLP